MADVYRPRASGSFTRKTPVPTPRPTPSVPRNKTEAERNIDPDTGELRQPEKKPEKKQPRGGGR